MFGSIKAAEIANVGADSQDKSAMIESLVEKAMTGDGDALQSLCEELGVSIVFRARYMLGSKMNKMDAEDVSQEVFLRMCEKIGDLRNPKAFGKWLSSIIINEVNRYAKNVTDNGFNYSIDEYFENILESNTEFIPEKHLENKDFSERLMKIILDLPLRQRHSIMLYYYDDLGVMEVAEVMNISHQCVSKNLARARENIKVALDKQSLTSNFGVISVLSIDAFLSNIIHAEAISFASQSAAGLEVLLAPCMQYFATGGAAATSAAESATGAVVGKITGAAAAVTIAGAICLGVFMSDAVQASTEVTPIQNAYVLFYGGDNYIDTNRVNPKQAEPKVESEVHDLKVLRWWITSPGDESVLYAGEGSDVSAAFSALRGAGSSGEYMVYFNVECQSGDVYLVGGNFLIMPVTS